MEGLQLVIMLIGGAISAFIAHSKGRNVVGWFFFGFLLPLIGIIVALVVSDLKEEERHRAHAQAERRRLKEQLRQEQIKNESFQRHATHRLDSHDQVLRIDTRRAAGLDGGGAPPVLSRGVPPPLAGEPLAWHYAARGEPLGPVTESELRDMLESGELATSTLVWKDGFPTWVPARTLAEFRDVGAP